LHSKIVQEAQGCPITSYTISGNPPSISLVQATVNGELKPTLRIDATSVQSDHSFTVTATNSVGSKTLTVNIIYEKSFETVTNLPPEFEQSLPAELIVEVIKDP
jgi:hypothetical protein